MKFTQKMCLLGWAALVATAAWGQPQAGKTYQIVNTESDYALTCRDNYAKDAQLYFDALDADASCQKWQVKAVPGVAGGFIIVSDLEPTMAVDAAPSRNYYPVLWTANTGSANQQFLIQAVDGAADTYRIAWCGDETRVLNQYFTDYAKFFANNSLSATAFRFIETTASPIPVRKEWEDETVVGINKLPAHASFMPYASTAALRADAQRYDTPWVDPVGADWLSLNGTWHLCWTQQATKAPAAEQFTADDVDLTQWDTLTVPSCLEMKGYGDPYYINVNYPFSDSSPYIRMKSGLYNSAATYRRSFTVPADWMQSNKRVVLHFDGIYSAAYVWVGQTYIGYTQGPNTDAEFDITSALKPGENHVSVQVIRFSDGSYLEGQDMWHMSGIHRDVYLYATPKTYVQDHCITAALNATLASATMNVELILANPAAEAVTKRVKVTLIDPAGEMVATETADCSMAAGDTLRTYNVLFENLGNVQLWSSERPQRYKVEIAQLDETGKEEMAFATPYGFRQVELKNGLVYVNGKRTYFKGVNTQDTHPVHGRTMPVETMLRDVMMMKQANINTVRTSHYPRQAKMYDMFDYYGLYCMDEADIECHFNWESGGNSISRADSWRTAFIDRIDRMVLRDRNHPSIVFWSLGNESGTGNNLQAAYDRCNDLDPERLIHYEGATRGGAAYTDLYSVMYPSLSKVTAGVSSNGTKQPYFMCEYAHAMGNAVGNLKEYWEAIEGSNYGIGGCIWDFVDQSIYHADDIQSNSTEVGDYHKYYAGYDYPGPHQGNFVNNGLVAADRAWSPELAEVKQIYQNVKFLTYYPADQSWLIRNNYLFTDLGDFDITYQLLEDGEVVEQHTEAMTAVKPGAQVKQKMNFTTELQPGKEYFLQATLQLSQPTTWAEAAYPVASQQVCLQKRVATLPEVTPTTTAQPIEVTSDANVYGNYTIKGDQFALTVNKSSGKITKWTYLNQTIIANATAAPDLSTYRWVENDKASGETPDAANGISERNLTIAPALGADGTVKFTVEASGSKANVTYDYCVYPNGVVDMTSSYEPLATDLRRLGTQLNLPLTFDQVNYYARGPWDNFIDRRDAAFFGRYTSSLMDMVEHTPRAQTCGNRTELRELLLMNSTADLLLKVEAEGQVDFQLLPYADEAMTTSSHLWEMTPTAAVLHLDYMQRGLGNGSCGQGTGVLADYTIPTGSVLSNKVRFTPMSLTQSGLTPIAAEEAAKVAVTAVGGVGTITLRSALPNEATAKVYDLGGSLVASCRVAPSAQHALTVISMAGQPAGTYLVSVAGVTCKVLVK